MKSKLTNRHLQSLVALSSFDIQPQQQQEKLGDLTRLAAMIAGSSFATINILDADIQWTIAAENMPVSQIARKETICQFAISQKGPLQIKNLSTHPDYQNLAFVQQHPELQYYLGIPILTELGSPIGVLCILNKENLELSAHTLSILQLIAGQVLTRLRLFIQLEHANLEVSKKSIHILKLAHDIKSPLNGMIGLSDYLVKTGVKSEVEDAPELLSMLSKGMTSLLSMTEDVLAAEVPALHHQSGVTVTLEALARQIEDLHLPQALSKNISLKVDVDVSSRREMLHKFNLVQIASNLISNAIKFTPDKGNVRVEFNMLREGEKRTLEMIVADNGVGMDTAAQTEATEPASVTSTDGTAHEKGTGYGLAIVRMLVEELDGKVEVFSKPGYGTTFRVLIPQVSL